MFQGYSKIISFCITSVTFIIKIIYYIEFHFFCHRYRILDTKANFIFIFDHRLFVSDLQFLWKRIINVIFIRENTGLKMLGSQKKIVPWFEITTVPFPSPIEDALIPKRLDIWRNFKFRIGEINL